MAKRGPRRSSRRRVPRAADAGGPVRRVRSARATATARRPGGPPLPVRLRTGPSPTPGSAPSSSERVTRPGLSWGRGAVVRAVAIAALVAGAIGAVGATATLISPDRGAPASRARFTAVRVTPGVPLGEYRQRSTAMVPAGSIGTDPGAPPRPAPSTPAVGSPAAPAVRARAAPAPGRAAGAGTTVGWGLTPPAGPRVTTGPASTLDADIADGFTVPPGFEERPIRLVDYTGEARHRVLDVLGCGDGVPCVDPVTLDYLVTANALDRGGDVVPPDVAAARVLALLGTARAGPAAGEPLGVVVTTELDLVGLRDEPALLTWSMWRQGGDVRLYRAWLDEDLAYRLRSTTDHDTVTLDLWVPLPTDPGPYVVRAALEASGSALARTESPPFT